MSNQHVVRVALLSLGGHQELEGQLISLTIKHMKSFGMRSPILGSITVEFESYTPDAMPSGAMDAADILLPVCSPDEARNQGINDLILAFRQQGQEKKIIPLIVAGEPNASWMDKKGIDAQQECYCPALQFQIGETGQLDPNQRMEPIGLELRADPAAGSFPGAGLTRKLVLRKLLKVASLKLAAELMSVPFAELDKRHFRWNRQFLLSIIIILFLFVIVFGLNLVVLLLVYMAPVAVGFLIAFPFPVTEEFGSDNGLALTIRERDIWSGVAIIQGLFLVYGYYSTKSVIIGTVSSYSYLRIIMALPDYPLVSTSLLLAGLVIWQKAKPLSVSKQLVTFLREHVVEIVLLCLPVVFADLYGHFVGEGFILIIMILSGVLVCIGGTYPLLDGYIEHTWGDRIIAMLFAYWFIIGVGRLLAGNVFTIWVLVTPFLAGTALLRWWMIIQKSVGDPDNPQQFPRT